MTNPIASSFDLQPPASSRTTTTIKTLRSSSSPTASTSSLSLSRQASNQSGSDSTATSRSNVSKDRRGKQNASHVELEKSKGGIRKPIPISSLQTPSLRSLVQDEEERLLSSQQVGTNGTEYQGEDAGGGEVEKEEEEDLPRSAILLPPLYGRPRPTPSPDLFTYVILRRY